MEAAWGCNLETIEKLNYTICLGFWMHFYPESKNISWTQIHEKNRNVDSEFFLTHCGKNVVKQYLLKSAATSEAL